MMRFREIGRTGIRISEIGFGCGNNAVLMVKAGYAEQLQAVRRALELGINFFDTAFAYGLGKSEENLGRILNDLGADPVISTKIRLDADAIGDLKRAAARAVEDALARLRRKHVHFVQLHTRVTSKRGAGQRFSLIPQEVLGPNGVIEGFKAMRDRGAVDRFGFSGLGDPEALLELVESGEFHGFQAYYNMLNPSSGHPVPAGFTALNYGQIIDRAAAEGMGAFVIRVLAAGALTSDPGAGGGSSPEPLSPGSEYALDLERAEKIKTALGLQSHELAGTAIRFGLMNPHVSTVLVGFSNTAHIDQAVACSGAPALTEQKIIALKELWNSDFGRLS